MITSITSRSILNVRNEYIYGMRTYICDLKTIHYLSGSDLRFSTALEKLQHTPIFNGIISKDAYNAQYIYSIIAQTKTLPVSTKYLIFYTLERNIYDE